MKSILLPVAVMLAIFGKTASAQTIITNAADPALTGPSVGVITFSTVTPGNYPSLTVSGVTFSGPTGVTVENLYAGQYNSTGNYLNNNNGTNSLLTLTFAAPMAAFGFNYGASDDPWTLSAYDAGNNLIASTTVAPIGGSASGEFIGIASPTPNIAYATFKDDGGIWFPDWILIDNVKRTEVPLPTNSAPVIVIAPGVLGVNLIWATNVIGFQLQTATNLEPPVVWQTVKGSPTVINSSNQQQVTSSYCAAFFRLANTNQ
jgi:hypothetical protein